MRRLYTPAKRADLEKERGAGGDAHVAAIGGGVRPSPRAAARTAARATARARAPGVLLPLRREVSPDPLHEPRVRLGPRGRGPVGSLHVSIAHLREQEGRGGGEARGAT